MSSNIVFMVDINKLDDPNNLFLLCDDMGVWKNNGVDSGCYVISMSSNGKVDTVDKSPNDEVSSVYTVFMEQTLV